ncbi:MAG: hypothetical protein NC093_03990 [Alistipes sp.]|nr:hypothetical protein [Alistipes sp.]
MGFFKDLKDAAKRGDEKGKQDIARRKEEERRKIEMLNDLSNRRNKANKDKK